MDSLPVCEEECIAAWSLIEVVFHVAVRETNYNVTSGISCGTYGTLGWTASTLTENDGNKFVSFASMLFARIAD
ncbi:hypothetical protein ACH5RR_027728 [Cinchona calisaya]|uniref:Uncharacterized protein n=1 Tax=Cinchona calisaya TaxID=153742 RepID=A0ABD2YPZ5_9GENT